MNKKMLEEYAKLVVNVGINVQKGQSVLLRCPVDCAEFGRLITTAAYEAGAKDVVIDWRDDHCSREHWLHADDSLFDRMYEWDVLKNNTLAKEGVGCISISASNPENLLGVDPERIRRFNIAANEQQKEFYNLMLSNGFPWCVVSIPIPSWAAKVFPELTPEEAVERLWEEIFKIVRITEDGNAVEAWNKHCDILADRASKLNNLKLKEVHYKNSLGTDLTVKMPANHIWAGGADNSQSGIRFVANMPTEEVFSAPLKDGVDGILYASKPLILNGNIVDGFHFIFKEGRIVEIHAEKGEEILKKAVDTDEGSHYLGEIALVPFDSPISNSGLLFYNTLFDENASCHFAFGSSYSSCVKGGDFMETEELLKEGINADSGMHVDFMVGTSDLSIIGIDENGNEVVIFKDGNFAF